MKKIVSILLTVVIVTSIAATFISRLYPETGMITEIENDIVTVTVANGNQFQFKGKLDYETEDLVSMTMFDCFTPEVKDDIIIKHQYSGFVELFEEIENSI